MPYYEYVWTSRAREKIALHGVTTHEVEDVIGRPLKTGQSKSSGRPMAMGWSDDGRWLVCIDEQLDELRIPPCSQCGLVPNGKDSLMRRIALSLLAVLALMTASYADVVDATHPANVGEVDALLRRIDQLERRIRELESRPHVTQSVPRVTYPPPRDGVLRADQVQIYMHYQMPARDVQTADKPPKAVEPATFQFRSGGITIVR